MVVLAGIGRRLSQRRCCSRAIRCPAGNVMIDPPPSMSHHQVRRPRFCASAALLAHAGLSRRPQATSTRPLCGTVLIGTAMTYCDVGEMRLQVDPGGSTMLGGWGESARLAARRMGAITAVGALLGLLVGGVGGRLAMMLLARLNPDVTGVTSDDGFTMGQFTVSDTLNLLLVGTLLGVVGSGIYALLRGLRIGPRWFQILAIGGGPAVVVGALIVHTDGSIFDCSSRPG